MNEYTKDLFTAHYSYQDDLRELLRDYEDKHGINKEVRYIVINHLNKVSESTIGLMKVFDKYEGTEGE